jgi:hypothetical protein
MSIVYAYFHDENTIANAKIRLGEWPGYVKIREKSQTQEGLREGGFGENSGLAGRRPGEDGNAAQSSR